MQIEEQVTKTVENVASDPTFGTLAGGALMIFALLIGFAFLLHGWPEINIFKKNK